MVAITFIYDNFWIIIGVLAVLFIISLIAKAAKVVVTLIIVSIILIASQGFISNMLEKSPIKVQDGVVTCTMGNETIEMDFKDIAKITENYQEDRKVKLGVQLKNGKIIALAIDNNIYKFVRPIISKYVVSD